jgi:hypothetical protein
MEIEVIKSWRGGTDNFLLYSTSSDIYFSDDPDREYIIYTFKNKHYQQGGEAREYILCEGDRSYMRNIAPFEYINNRQIQHMFPIRKDAETEQEWMLVMARVANAVIPESIERRGVNGDNQNIIEEMKLDQFLTTFIQEN